MRAPGLRAASFSAGVPHDLVAAFAHSLGSTAPVLRRVLPESTRDQLYRRRHPDPRQLILSCACAGRRHQQTVATGTFSVGPLQWWGTSALTASSPCTVLQQTALPGQPDPSTLGPVHRLADQLISQGGRWPGRLHSFHGLSRHGHACHQVSLPVRRSAVDRTDGTSPVARIRPYALWSTHRTALDRSSASRARASGADARSSSVSWSSAACVSSRAAKASSPSR
ncbi:hypothetical protein [Streptomyces sp. SCSIO 30461]|uniref:hypothetical protein n=1 Tax=Streptomyces sp. SCSIO 30461 TaxID=3118085 RepID=UPI00387E5826